jgi:hypothetical protein
MDIIQFAERLSANDHKRRSGRSAEQELAYFLGAYEHRRQVYTNIHPDLRPEFVFPEVGVNQLLNDVSATSRWFRGLSHFFGSSGSQLIKAYISYSGHQYTYNWTEPIENAIAREAQNQEALRDQAVRDAERRAVQDRENANWPQNNDDTQQNMYVTNNRCFLLGAINDEED